jgi:L-2-hydroxyglutarate oxidase
MTRAHTDVDVVIVGAGIVGLATAYAWHRSNPARRVLVLDKEAHVAEHQSGRNSGVIHAGVYYAPGSAKARLCREGRDAMLAFCREQDIRHEVCGKVVVATTTAELGRLDDLRQRCRANEVEVRLLDRRQLAEREPFVDGLAALLVPSTAIVDYREVCEVLARTLMLGGVEVRTGCEVLAIREAAAIVTVDTPQGAVTAQVLVNCAGVHSDEVARTADPSGQAAGPTILPFRGEYFELRAQRRHLVRHLVYPVPDPRFPFLGVHFTRDVHGGIHAGPNAVLALGREAYTWRSSDGREALAMARRGSTWRLAGHHARTGAAEVARSLSRARFTRALQRLVPDVRAEDLVPAPAGIRAQAVDRHGRLLDDFAFAATARTLHVINAPSPAATASLAIGAQIAGRIHGDGRSGGALGVAH